MADLKAGRELDALVAEKVMGWLRSRGCGNGREWDGRGVVLVPPDHFKDYRKPVEIPSDPITNFGTTPRYSTDIAAAWEVVEKTWQQVGMYFELERNSVSGDLWKATFSPYSGSVAQAQADTAPLAICLAALKAAEVPHV